MTAFVRLITFVAFSAFILWLSYLIFTPYLMRAFLTTMSGDNVTVDQIDVKPNTEITFTNLQLGVPFEPQPIKAKRGTLRFELASWSPTFLVELYGVKTTVSQNDLTLRLEYDLRSLFEPSQNVLKLHIDKLQATDGVVFSDLRGNYKVSQLSQPPQKLENVNFSLKWKSNLNAHFNGCELSVDAFEAIKYSNYQVQGLVFTCETYAIKVEERQKSDELIGKGLKVLSSQSDLNLPNSQKFTFHTDTFATQSKALEIDSLNGEISMNDDKVYVSATTRYVGLKYGLIEIAKLDSTEAYAEADVLPDQSIGGLGVSVIVPNREAPSSKKLIRFGANFDIQKDPSVYYQFETAQSLLEGQISCIFAKCLTEFGEPIYKKGSFEELATDLVETKFVSLFAIPMLGTMLN